MTAPARYPEQSIIGRVGFEISMLIRKYSIAYKLLRSQIRIPLGTLLRAYKRF